MKTPSDELFQLIKSLSPHEKRYFKLYSSLHSPASGSKNYLKVFDIIERLDVYDEPQLKKKLGDKNLAKNLKRVKSYISEVILSSLENYHSNDSVEIDLHKKAQQIEILCHKKLFGLAKKIINKAYEMALTNEKTLYILIFLSWKRKITGLTQGIDGFDEFMKDGVLYEFNYLEKYKNELDYLQLVNQAIPLIHSKHFYDESVKEELKRITSQPHIKNRNKTEQTFDSLRGYYAIMALATRVWGDKERSLLFRVKLVEHYESNKLRLKSDTTEYIGAVNNLLIILAQLDRYDAYDAYYFNAKKNVDAFDNKYKTKLVMEAYGRLHVSRLDVLLELKKFKQAHSLVKEMEYLLVGDRSMDLSSHIYFFYFSFITYFNLSDFRSALKYINKLVNMDDEGIKQDILIDSRLLLLIVHYELKNHDLLISLSKSIKNFLLKKRGYLFGYEKIIIDLLGKEIHKIKAGDKEGGLFSVAKKKLDLIIKQNKEKQATEYFDYSEWMKGKIK